MGHSRPIKGINKEGFMYSVDVFLNTEILIALFLFIQTLLILLSNNVQCYWDLTSISAYFRQKRLLTLLCPRGSCLAPVGQLRTKDVWRAFYHTLLTLRSACDVF